MAILLALGSCSDALELAPVAAVLQAAGRRFRLAFCGEEHAFAEARELGLDGPLVARALPAGPPAARFAAAAAFAAELLCERPAMVLTIGHGLLAQTLGAAAGRAGVPVLRLGAGLRTHGPDQANDRHRRLADHAGDAFCVATDWQRQELLREGASPAAVHVVGSLIADALAKLPPPPSSPPYLWLAIEHAATVAEPGPRAAVLAAVVAAAEGLPVRAVPTMLAGVPAPGVAVFAGGARAQLDGARAARVVVTDSVGHQELAWAAGVPCVVLPGCGSIDGLVAAGVVTAADDVPGLADAVARALAAPAAPARPAAGAAARVLPALDALLAPPAAPARAPVTLPSDGDASGRTLGADEVALAAAAIRSGTLNSTRGRFVVELERRFAAWLGRKHVVACGSGTAAMHAAIASLQLQPGDEVVTTPITDMGALTPILYEGGVPVFADVDPTTMNVTAATLRARVTPRTRALVATHLFGSPCDLAAITALSAELGLPLIEDVAQAFGATAGGRRAGTHGQLAAFSLQQGKHITTGEGGLVATDDEALARRLFLFVNKAWGYGDPTPDHTFPALNGRLTELQGAVALAQIGKLDQVVARRRAVAADLRAALAGVPGLSLPSDPPWGTHSYWKFAFHVDAGIVPGGAVALGQRMQAAGIACVPRYVQKPAFECELFRHWRRSAVSWQPLQHNPRGAAPGPLFDRRDFPGAVRALDTVVVLPINERYTGLHVRHVADRIRAAAAELQHA